MGSSLAPFYKKIKMKPNLSLIMRSAWAMFKRKSYVSFSMCLKMAWVKWQVFKVGKKGGFQMSFKRKCGKIITRNCKIIKYKSQGFPSLITLKNINTGGFVSTHLHNVVELNLKALK